MSTLGGDEHSIGHASRNGRLGDFAHRGSAKGNCANGTFFMQLVRGAARSAIHHLDVACGSPNPPRPSLAELVRHHLLCAIEALEAEFPRPLGADPEPETVSAAAETVPEEQSACAYADGPASHNNGDLNA